MCEQLSKGFCVRIGIGSTKTSVHLLDTYASGYQNDHAK